MATAEVTKRAVQVTLTLSETEAKALAEITAKTVTWDSTKIGTAAQDVYTTLKKTLGYDAFKSRVRLSNEEQIVEQDLED